MPDGAAFFFPPSYLSLKYNMYVTGSNKRVALSALKNPRTQEPKNPRTQEQPKNVAYAIVCS